METSDIFVDDANDSDGAYSDDWDCKVQEGASVASNGSEASSVGPLQRPEGPNPFGYLARKFQDSSGRSSCPESLLEAAPTINTPQFSTPSVDTKPDGNRLVRQKRMSKIDSPKGKGFGAKKITFDVEDSNQRTDFSRAGTNKPREQDSDGQPGTVRFSDNLNEEPKESTVTDNFLPSASAQAGKSSEGLAKAKPKSKGKPKSKAKAKSPVKSKAKGKARASVLSVGAQSEASETSELDEHDDKLTNNDQEVPGLSSISEEVDASTQSGRQSVSFNFTSSSRPNGDAAGQEKASTKVETETDALLKQTGGGYMERHAQRKRSSRTDNDKKSRSSVDTKLYFTGDLPLDTYKGEQVGGKRQGYGQQLWPTGEKYQGQWQGNLAHGLGEFQYGDGCIYVGEWKAGRAHGNGVLHVQWPEERTWAGNFENDQLVGPGTETWQDGSEYAGQFAAGCKHGHGVMTRTDGKSYLGTWKDNEQDGVGRLTGKEDHTVFEGQWKRGLIEGVGQYRWEGGWSYKGQYVEEAREGFGVFQWPDDSRYEGFWKDGLRNGRHIWFPGSVESPNRTGRNLRQPTPLIFEPKGRRNFAMSDNSKKKVQDDFGATASMKAGPGLRITPADKPRGNGRGSVFGSGDPKAANLRAPPDPGKAAIHSKSGGAKGGQGSASMKLKVNMKLAQKAKE